MNDGRRSLDALLVNNDDLLRKRRRYEVLRGALVTTLVGTALALVVLVLLVLQGVRAGQQATLRAQHSLADLAKQNKTLLDAQARADAAAARSDAARAKLTAQAIKELLARQQAQLDEMDARDRDRLQDILTAIRALPHGQQVPFVVLAPTPIRAPEPSPTPQPAPTPTGKHNGKHK